MVKQRAYSILGNIAIVNFPDKKFNVSQKKKFADSILKQNKAVRTVLEKSGKFAGRLRKMTTKHLAGEKTKEVLSILYKDFNYDNLIMFKHSFETEDWNAEDIDKLKDEEMVRLRKKYLLRHPIVLLFKLFKHLLDPARGIQTVKRFIK